MKEIIKKNKSYQHYHNTILLKNFIQKLKYVKLELLNYENDTRSVLLYSCEANGQKVRLYY